MTPVTWSTFCQHVKDLLFLQVVQEQLVQLQDPPQLQVPAENRKIQKGLVLITLALTERLKLTLQHRH